MIYISSISLIICSSITLCFSQAKSIVAQNFTLSKLNPTVTYVDESKFVSSLEKYIFKSPDQVNLNREAVTAEFMNVYGYNIPADRYQIGFKWNSGDQNTNEWRPQGIAGFNSLSRKRRYLLITWYAISPANIPNVNNQHKGSRLSLVDITDMKNIKYRHILLVQSDSNISNRALFSPSNNKYIQLGSFIPVTSHVGGIAYHSGKIYVAETNLGIRVFDLDKIIEVESNPEENAIGKSKEGKLVAFNYSYILPQIGYYKISFCAPFSSVEIEKGDNALTDMIWTGQYISDSESDGRTPLIIGFPIDVQGNITTPAKIVYPKDEEQNVVFGMQGVYRYGSKTVMAITGCTPMSITGRPPDEKSTARLVIYRDGDTHASRYSWPHGAEDLYVEDRFDPVFKKTFNLLWCLTEYETQKYGKENRCVFAVKLSDYK